MNFSHHTEMELYFGSHEHFELLHSPNTSWQGGSRISKRRGTNSRDGCANLLLPPANEVCECYVFTGVCQCLFKGAGYACIRGVHGGACVAGGVRDGGVRGRRDGHCSGRTHPTGMHSCFAIFLPKTT